MSDESAPTQVFAVSDSRPPEAWVSDWVMYQGIRISGSDIPDGFRQVDEAEYLEALSYQKSASDSLQESAIAVDDSSQVITDPVTNEEPVE